MTDTVIQATRDYETSFGDTTENMKTFRGTGQMSRYYRVVVAFACLPFPTPSLNFVQESSDLR
ncbi:hypothetical protein B0O99DRAFT_687281 [Bisporella sp. PMI_857]|nr:hypothetical protein B0O99DRAFT_687281 [Bisporella sp. PMI_857]